MTLTSGTKDEEFPSVLQTIVFTVENGWCGGEKPRHISDDLQLRCHDFRPTDSSRASWLCLGLLGGRRGFPARRREFVAVSPISLLNSANTTHPVHRPSLLIMSLVARTPVLQRQILRSRAFVPSRGAHSGYKVCVHGKNQRDGASSPHPLSAPF